MIFTPRPQSDKGLVGDFKKTLGDVEILYGFEISKQMTQVLKLEWTTLGTGHGSVSWKKDYSLPSSILHFINILR